MFVDLKKTGAFVLKGCFGKSSLTQGGLVQCDDFRIIAHGIPVLHDREMLLMDEFAGQSCFEIANSDECKGLWKPTGRTGTSQEKGTCVVHTSHPNWERLRDLYMEKSGKRGETLTEATTSPRLKVIDSDNL